MSRVFKIYWPHIVKTCRVVIVFVREKNGGHIIYMLMITPSDDYTMMQPAFDHMVRTLRVNSNVAHD